MHATNRIRARNLEEGSPARPSGVHSMRWVAQRHPENPEARHLLEKGSKPNGKSTSGLNTSLVVNRDDFEIEVHRCMRLVLSVMGVLRSPVCWCPEPEYV